MQTLTPQPLLSFDGCCYTIGDAVLAGLLRGDWQRFERELAAGIARERDVAPGPVGYERAVRDLGIAWRNARGLVAADDFSAWLARRGLTLEDWEGHLRRRLLLSQGGERWTDLAGHPPPSAELAGAARSETLCSGVLAGLGNALVLRCGAQRALAEADPGARAPGAGMSGGRVEQLVGEALSSATAGLASVPAPELLRRAKAVVALEDAHARFTTAVADDAAIARWLRVKRLQLLRFAWDDVFFESEDAAREAALLVREGDLDITEVARAAGATSTRRAGYASDLDVSLGPRLVGALPGDVVGPFPQGATWRLVSVDDRVAPSSEDPELRARAIGAIVGDRLERHIVGKVVWHVDP